MKTRKMLSILVGLILFALLVWMVVSSRQPSLPSASAQSMGLTWTECEMSGAPDWRKAEPCLGHPMPRPDADSREVYGKRFDYEGIQLVIGQDVYETNVSGEFIGWSRYSLYKNSKRVKSLFGQFTAFSPNVSLQNVGGKAVWEFSDAEESVTVIDDGVDLRKRYDLDKAYRPYGLGDKLIFVGVKHGRQFIVYDGQKIEHDFDLIHIAYCCEPVLWSVWPQEGTYTFWAERAGKLYLVEVALPEE